MTRSKNVKEPIAIEEIVAVVGRCRMSSDTWVAVTEGLPEGGRTVIAWQAEDEMPCAAFFDPDPPCWYAQADGTAFDDGAVTHWRHYVGPGGETSGREA